MNKVIKGKNRNNKRALTLLIFQIAVGILPILLLVVFVTGQLYRNSAAAAIVIGLILLCNGGYMVLARRYGVIHSGLYGEKQLYRTVKRLSGSNIIFRNLPIKYKRGRSEADLLIVSHKGVIIIEAKNHSGTIVGNWKNEKWEQRKTYRDGRAASAEMENPLRQMRRQRDIVKSILMSNGENVWVDSVLYFSSPMAKLRLTLRENDYVCSTPAELIRFLEDYAGGETLSRTRMDKIAAILKKQAFGE